MHLMLTLCPNSTTTHHNSCLLNSFWHTQRWLEHLQTFSATFKSTKNFGRRLDIFGNPRNDKTKHLAFDAEKVGMYMISLISLIFI